MMEIPGCRKYSKQLRHSALWILQLLVRLQKRFQKDHFWKSGKKQRLQQEMQSFLLLRQKLKDDNELCFGLLCQAAIETPRILNLSSSEHFSGPYGESFVFIANDWHTSLLPCYLKTVNDRIFRVLVKVTGGVCLYTCSVHKASSSLESKVICVVYEELESRGHVL